MSTGVSCNTPSRFRNGNVVNRWVPLGQPTTPHSPQAWRGYNNYDVILVW